MATSDIIIVEGKKYVSTKIIAKTWGLTRNTVSDYCKSNKIINKFKDGNRWYIRTDEIKPLTNEEIHRLLMLTLQLKNNPSLKIDWSTFSFDDSFIEYIYQNLVEQKYIEQFTIRDKKRIPYEVILTQKGLDIAMKYRKGKTNDFSAIVSQWLPIIINVAQLCVAIAK